MKKKITSFFMALLLVMLCAEPVRAESAAVHENQIEIGARESEDASLDMAVDKDSLSSRFKIYESDDFSEGQSRIPLVEQEETDQAIGRSSPVSGIQTFIEGDFKYAILADGSVKVVDYLGNEADVVVPSMADGHSVKAIGTYAFAHDHMIETLTLSEGIIALEQESIFGCSSLRELNLPASLGMDSENSESSVITGLSSVPMYCDKLEVITVPEESEIFTAQDGVLYNKRMTELLYYSTGKKDEKYTIPDGVKTIGSDSFHGNIYLKKVSMPDTVTYIGYWAFCGASALREINISSNCTTIGQYALSGTAIETLELPATLDAFLVWEMYMDSLKSITVEESNPVYSSYDGVLYDKNKTCVVYCPSAKEGDYAIPDSVTYIDERAFSGCSLSSVIIPWSAAIGSDNFLGNRNPFIIYGYNGSAAQIYAQDYELEFVSIGEVPSVEVASGSCGEHLTWRLDSRGVLTISGTGMMNSAPWQENYRNRITRIVIEEGVESIAGWGQYHGLSNITLPSSLKIIGDEAFNLCPRLSDVVIPDGVKEIGRSAFNQCDNLTNIFIPASVEKIGQSAFNWCESLEEITVDLNNWNYSSVDGVLFDKNQTELIQYPAGKSGYGAYVIPAGVQKIGYGAFAYSRSNFDTIVIPDSVVDIKEFAFGDSYVQNVFIGEGTTNIERGAFHSCQSLHQIFIGSNVSHIGIQAFGGLYSLRTVYYASSQEEWDRITIDDFNDDLYRADIIYGKEIVSFNTEHVLEVIGSKAPTCLENGNIYYFKCTDCGKCYSDPTGVYELTEEQIVASAKGHKIKRVEAKEATCTENGNALHYKCISCGRLYRDAAGEEELTEEDVAVPAKGHELEKVEAKGVTCTENGNVLHYKCISCGKLYRDAAGEEELSEEEVLIPTKDHIFGKWEITVQPDYGKEGTEQRVCSLCGKSETRITPELEGKLEIGSVNLSQASYTYNGKVQKPTVTVKDSKGKVLKLKKDYTISFPKGMKNVGRYTVTVTLKGNYKGTIDKTFDIVPKGTAVSKVTAKKKGFVVKWKKQVSQTTGYEIWC